MTDSSTGGFIAPYEIPFANEGAGFDALLQALVVGVTALAPNLVRPRWQLIAPAQPEPSTNWCAIGEMDSEPEINIAQTHFPAPNGPTELGYTASQQNDIVDVLASFYGPNARENAKLLQHGLMMGQNRETLYTLNVQLMEAPGKPVNASYEANGQWTLRFDIPIRFRRKTVMLWPIDDLAGAQIEIVNDDGYSQAADVTNPPT